MTVAPRMMQAQFRGQLGAFALDAAFAVPAEGVTGLFGPSGSGKSSVLRCIAGLQRVDVGRFTLGNDTWQDATTFRKAHQRPVGYVFQESSLFQHLSVRGNLLYGAPRDHRPEPAAIGFDETVDLLGLDGLLDRAPRHLSGGERQRVAIGRALLSQPELLLMDEPLSALDRQAKDDILPFLERLHGRLRLPAIYVSHDIGEIERLADHLVLMRAGKVIAAGPLHAVQSDPALPLAGARDASVSLDAVVEGRDADYGIVTLRVEGGRLFVPAAPVDVGARRRISIAAGDVSIALTPPQDSSILNALPCRIHSMTPLNASEVLIVVGLGAVGEGARLLARVTRRSCDHLDLSVGMSVVAQVKGVALTPRRDG